MPRDSSPPSQLEIAITNASRAVREYDGACAWLKTATPEETTTLGVEVWLLDPLLEQVLLVDHRWRGWVPPGGRLEPGENPRDGAMRELFEETGLVAKLLESPAAVAVRSYRPGWPVGLGLSYAAIASTTLAVDPEPGQPAKWKFLARPWTSTFPDDRNRICRYVAWLRRDGSKELPRP
jgi:8-oxo-dGTP diphosphatase